MITYYNKTIKTSNSCCFVVYFPVCTVLLKGLQDVMEAPSSTVNKVVVVGSRSVHASSSPVTALQIPVQIPVQITHVCECSPVTRCIGPCSYIAVASSRVLSVCVKCVSLVRSFFRQYEWELGERDDYAELWSAADI